MNKIISGVSMLLIAMGISSCANNTTTGSDIDTYEFTITNLQWTPSGTGGTDNYTYYHNHAMSQITANVMSSGMVLCYLKSGPQYLAMPYIETYIGYTVAYGYQYEEGTLYISRKDSDLNTVPPTFNVTVKVVILTDKNMELVQGIDLSNYNEVSEALNLEK